MHVRLRSLTTQSTERKEKKTQKKRYFSTSQTTKQPKAQSQTKAMFAQKTPKYPPTLLLPVFIPTSCPRFRTQSVTSGSCNSDDVRYDVSLSNYVGISPGFAFIKTFGSALMVWRHFNESVDKHVDRIVRTGIRH